MKPPNNNNEADLWLRSLAKGERAGLTASPESALGDSRLSSHLDADELNTFAEGLVPEPARARYLEHLADCSSCRTVVTGLTQAAGGLKSLPLETATTTAGFWSKLSGFFSASALRYAVPAFAFAVLIGIAVLVMRQAPTSDFVAKREVKPQAGEQTTADDPTANSSSEIAPQASLEPRQNVADDSYSQDKIITSQPPKDSSTPATVAKNAAEPGGVGAVSKPTFAPEPATAAPPPPRAVPEDADRLAALKKKEEGSTATNNNRNTRSRQETRLQPIAPRQGLRLPRPEARAAPRDS